ncbi:nitrate reductase associated protein [Pseudanabaena mucicola]|uniref:Nitrate reductase associated protein n=1 Tax=Pseudanabaena mucicola FACHB-723 TaxID=2692860 RepID=A0ABR7ZYT2_9CYAN|nr:nitrate reductase associated protein [Pseudanabaena mucicola]MBD2188675.1 nitrate reductase associated protein [Pseudanabaena mucicola FACHB-723]
MLQFFEFEADFVASLRCIPMQVRYKLDTCGIKLKLQHWHSFSTLQRQRLIDLPCDTDAEIANYRENLRSQVFQNLKEYPSDLPIAVNPEWMQLDLIPNTVINHAKNIPLEISISQWQALNPLQRFALIKLSTSNHENNNFLPALQEFGLSHSIPQPQ